ncbi:EI24 domain-containing protein [Sphingomonas montanisoli]|uniref:EI24 domain-containing protein n=1 Tax=Sphingomonas montanisoli TaxID=2606412 RepID=A0A5D9BZS3_9SPHN|nr:EI24 domain-containing protein [Sphingomonas montanisoli]TZG24954.1 hypothetical protein FYJ91_16920 [Sphingomonas montanisoli]
MIQTLFLSLSDFADRRIVGIFLRSMLVTLLIFAALAVLVGWALVGVDPCSWFDGSCPLDATGGGIGAVALTLLAGWFLFPAIAVGVLCAYIDRVVAIVEARHYPQAAATARSPGVASVALLGLRSAGRVLLYNLIALPFYILLLFTVIGPFALFVAVNGAALGRDLGEMVASRHGDRASRAAWLVSSRVGRFLIGAITTFLFLIPFANLLAPILGGAMATHLYHRRTHAHHNPAAIDRR